VGRAARLPSLSSSITSNTWLRGCEAGRAEGTVVGDDAVHGVGAGM
jgi:hypothetical protein